MINQLNSEIRNLVKTLKNQPNPPGRVKLKSIA